jgi:hypothetical protein
MEISWGVVMLDIIINLTKIVINTPKNRSREIKNLQQFWSHQALYLHLKQPDPVQDQLTVSLGDNELNIGRADLIDFSGRNVRTVLLSSGNEITIDCNDLPAGIYILRLSGDSVVNEKIVINR